MTPARLARTLHKWLALFVGLQALVWILSGFYMVVVDLDFIHGDSLVRNVSVPVPQTGPWLSIDELRRRHSGIESVRIKGLPGFDRPLYEIRSASKVALIDSATGEPISPLAESAVTALARQYYAGNGAIARTELLTGETPLEIQSRPLPLWRVRFDDWHETTLYIHPDSGDLVTRRHRSWRWFDFLWMLHIMDYDQRTDVNNTPLRIATIAGLVFVASGAWLLIHSFRRRRARLSA
ncbi:MAG: PepSY domain-containing protein [Gemmatimonadetes bacterium]|nr:PepSY domain-containing protein [Gemmatimonadota bacterium]